MENSNFEIHTEKKFLDPCNNMERLKLLIKKNCCFYHIFYIFGIKKLKADRFKNC